MTEDKTMNNKNNDFNIASFVMSGIESVIMLSFALALDIIGIILFVLSFFGIGIVVSYISDVIGILVIGGWTLFHSGKVIIPQKKAERLKKGVKKIAKQTFKTAVKKGIKIGGKIAIRLTLAIGELIPFVGDIAPCWTLIVFLELKKTKK